MELYHLRSFVTVAEEGRLTLAAKRLFTSQPAVSAHIKALEEELGMTLFTRTPKGMELTPAGVAIKHYAERCLESVCELLHEAKRLKQDVMGQLDIGLNTEPDILRTGELLAAMAENYPKLTFHLHQRNSWNILNELKTGTLDAGYVFGEVPAEEITAISLKACSLCIVGPIKWKGRFEQASLEQLASFPWIWIPLLCPFHKLADRLFERRQLLPNKVVVADQEATLKNLVISGVGLSFMIEDDALKVEREGTIAIWKKERPPIDLLFAYSRKRENDPMIQALLTGITRIWG